MAGVMIGMITAGNVDMRTTQSLLATQITGTAAAICIQQNGPYLDIGRNKMVDTFRDDPAFAHCDRLLFVDSDIIFEPGHIQTLVDDDLPIVSGVYHSLFQDGRIRPVVYEWTIDEHGLRTMTPINTWRPHGDDEHLVQVEAVGAGFLMIARDVVEKFTHAHLAPQCWFGNDIIGRTQLGEDLTFCVRATDLGIPVMVDRRVHVAHHKSIVFQGPYKMPGDS
jgi:hypothetical protein